MSVRRPRRFAAGLDRSRGTPGRSSETATDSSVPASPSDGEGPEPTTAIDDTGEVLDGEHADGTTAPEDRRVELSASFSGPLPPPAVLEGYEKAVPGLAREIADQWKAETSHRHATIDGLRETDRDAMLAFYKGERRGQYLATALFVGIIGVAILGILRESQAIGISAIVAGGTSAVWAMRRRSSGPSPPADLDDGDALEKPDST
jgi:uncharacterized membrane protein